MEKRIQLSSVLEQITSELRDASERAKSDGTALMRFEECELEFAIEVEQKAKGGIEVWLANLGGSLKRTEAHTLKVKYVALRDAPSPGDTVASAHAADKHSTRPPIRRTGRKLEN